MDRSDVIKWIIVVIVLVMIASAVGMSIYMNEASLATGKTGGCAVEGFDRFVEPAV